MTDLPSLLSSSRISIKFLAASTFSSQCLRHGMDIRLARSFPHCLFLPSVSLAYQFNFFPNFFFSYIPRRTSRSRRTASTLLAIRSLPRRSTLPLTLRTWHMSIPSGHRGLPALYVRVHLRPRLSSSHSFDRHVSGLSWGALLRLLCVLVVAGLLVLRGRVFSTTVG